MMILTWLLTFILMLDCLVLGLLVLIQLPKKEAGLGQAFGASTTDALFGAGSGTALTKMTKYTAGIFFVLTLLLAVVHGQASRSKTVDPRIGLSQEDKLSTITPGKASTNTAAAAATSPTQANKVTLNLTNINTNAAPAVEKPANK